MKKNLVALFAAAVMALPLAACGSNQSSTSATSAANATSATQQSTATSSASSGRPSGGGGGKATNDAEAQAVIDDNAAKFQQFTFEDEQTGSTLEYSLFIPEGASDGDPLPLIMYIPDSTGANIGAQAIVQNYYGADVWVTEEDQAKHPSFVLVPAFSGTATTDNWEVSDEVDMTIRLIESLQEQYNIDASRLYTTGQSMGCMSSLYLNSTHPGFFAASMYVSGQWDISVLKGMEEQKFFYIVAGGDSKASAGQDEVIAMFKTDNAPYTYGEWDAQNDQEEQDAAVQALIDEGCDANMIRFESGTVLAGQSGMEHMASFNYAYKLTPARDWLFEQSL